MSSLVLGARMLLAAVFLTAAVGKLLDLPGSRRALAGFGVPARALRAAAIVLPLAELATAVALLFAQSARWGALAALMLLLAFIAGIAVALARGQAPDCHCFGQVHSSPAGPGTLARNAALAALAMVVVWHGAGPSLYDWAAARTAAELAAVGSSIIAALLACISWRLWLDRRALQRDLDTTRAELASLPPGLPIGVPAPSFALPGLQGQTLTLEALCARGKPVVLVFISPGCPGCRALLPDLGRWQATLAEHLTVAVLSISSTADDRPAFEEHGITDVMLQKGVDVMADYRVQATPSAVVVTSEGIVASVPAAGAATIEPLVRLTMRRASTGFATAGPLASPQ